MKETIRKRGLYRLVTRSPENDDEQLQLLRSLAGALQQYVDDAERAAGDILRRHDIDPETLWDVVETAEINALRFATLDRGSLPAEADQALDVMWNVRCVRQAGLELPDRASAVIDGVRLAQSIERLNANLAFANPVQKYSRMVAAIRKTKTITADDLRRAELEHQSREDQAKALGISTRQLRRLRSELP